MNDPERSALKEALEAAIRATAQMQETYNNYLRKVDELHAVPSLEDSVPLIRQLQKSINELYDVTSVTSQESRWNKRESSPSWKQQKEWNAAAVHLLNELIEYVSRSSAQMRRLLEEQVLFFQQITPWIDTKIQQLQREEKLEVETGVKQLGALLGGQNPEKIIAQFYSLQSQLYEQSLANERRLQEISAKIGESTPEVHELTRIKLELQELRDVVRAPRPEKPEGDTSVPQADFPATRDFRYFVFEELFRGSSEWITERLKSYIPYFVTAPEPVVDIGCGRGEFLTLMKEIGKDAYGIEVNRYEIESLTKQGFKVIEDQILPHVHKLEKESIGSVFCAQVVEHLAPDHVYQMLSRLQVVMKSGASLVIETINPLSVFAFHHLFFKDPTHIFPVHPQTLAFLLRYAGFQNVEIHTITPVPDHERLPKPTSVKNPETQGYLNYVIEQLNDLLYSNLEYYVVGHKL